MRPCQVRLRTMIPPRARNEQCGLETALKSCPPSKFFGSMYAGSPPHHSTMRNTRSGPYGYPET